MKRHIHEGNYVRPATLDGLGYELVDAFVYGARVAQSTVNLYDLIKRPPWPR